VRLTADFLADRFGLADQPMAAFADAMSAAPLAAVRDCVGEVALLSVWLTGYALGVLRAERSPAAAGHEPAGPLACLALASLAPGGLRRFLAPPLLDRVADPLGGFVMEAVHRGSGVCR
jgi:hypothetical protein